MEQSSGKTYSFEQFTLDADERTLLDGTRPIQLPPKVFDTLLMLIENAGRVLSKERMMSAIWEDSFVEENNLAQNISSLRKTLGETREHRFIETVPKFGYRFVASVESSSNVDQEVIQRTSARIYITDGDQTEELGGD